jgi:O-acetylhomoserine (thiol)-lyase
MGKPRTFDLDTLSLHAGQRPDASTGARATPIYQTASYVFKDTDHAASIFNIERTGHVYSRISNPTNAVLEERISALEGGVGAIATASGQAAMHLAVATLMGAGSHIVSSQSLYGGTHNLLAYTMPRFGIETTFVDPRDPQAFRQAIRPNTRLLFGETLGNPGLEVLDIPRVSEVAHDAGLPLMIDSTFTTPFLCRPFDLGADIVMHSATKFLSGHGVVIAIRGIPRPGFCRGIRTCRLHHASPQGRRTGFWRLHERHDVFPDSAGTGNPAPAHAETRRQCT